MDSKSNSAKYGPKRIAALIAGGVLALGVALPAAADHGHDYGGGYGHYKHKKVHVYHHYPRPVRRVYVEYYYPRPVEHVRVEHHYYPVPEPRPEYVEPQYQPPPSGGYYRGSAGPSGSALIGAAVGGLLGSQAGKGTGKLAATAAGTLAGFLIGSR